jgi:hypothetical protein
MSESTANMHEGLGTGGHRTVIAMAGTVSMRMLLFLRNPGGLFGPLRSFYPLSLAHYFYCTLFRRWFASLSPRWTRTIHTTYNYRRMNAPTEPLDREVLAGPPLDMSREQQLSV